MSTTAAPFIAASNGVLTDIITAKVALNTFGIICPPASFQRHTFYIIGNGAVGAGAIEFSAAQDPSYTGTWSVDIEEVSPVTVVADSVICVSFVGLYKALKARISTLVTVGTVTVKYQGSVD